MTLIHAPDRRDVAIVPAVGDANVLEPDRLPQRRIQAKPTRARNEHFRPGMRGLAADHFLHAGPWLSGSPRHQVSGYISRGETRTPQNSEQNMREVLTHA